MWHSCWRVSPLQINLLLLLHHWKESLCGSSFETSPRTERNAFLSWQGKVGGPGGRGTFPGTLAQLSCPNHQSYCIRPRNASVAAGRKSPFPGQKPGCQEELRATQLPPPQLSPRKDPLPKMAWTLRTQVVRYLTQAHTYTPRLCLPSLP